MDIVYNSGMKKILFALALTSALSGCSKSDKGGGGEGSAAAAPASKCAAVAAKAVSGLPAGADAGGIQAKLQAILTARCTEDTWPTAVLECYAGVKDMSGMRACRELLPAEQQQKLMGEIRSAMMGVAGAMGNPHGGGPGAMPPGAMPPGATPPAPAPEPTPATTP